MQITSSSVGVNPIAVENGPLKVLRCHMMLSTFGITSETEAGTMTHAHTFGNRSPPPPPPPPVTPVAPVPSCLHQGWLNPHSVSTGEEDIPPAVGMQE